jgi:hypothetical protein
MLKTEIVAMKCLALISWLLISSHTFAQQQPRPFYPNATYEEDIPTFESVLGFPLGQRPVRYDEAIRYLKILADASPRVTLIEFGETYEKRKLYYAVVTSEDNHARLKGIQENLNQLSRALNLSPYVAEKIINSTPAAAWMAYGIHGDELSSTDASLQVVYQLAAGTDSTSVKIRKEVVVCVDPMQNPDGRERYLAQMQQWAGAVQNPDVQSIQHTGMWPWGRGNHYLFDLNRDWFILAHPETRASVKAILEWNPQLVVDSHEMGAFSTYFFNPPRAPINPNVSTRIRKWWQIFAADQAKAFDQYGWSYYTQESFDEWYPGYGEAWPLFLGAVGILYEQASTDGSLVKRPDGTILTFREAVHHHFVSSVANLTTAADNRKQLLKDFFLAKKNGMAGFEKGEPFTYFIVPGDNPSRVQQLVEKLIMQKIEVRVAENDIKVSGLHDYWDSKTRTRVLPKGTFIVSLNQPLGLLAKTILEFDPRMSSSFLNEERRSLEKDNRTKIYDVTAWSLPLAYGVESYWSSEKLAIRTKPINQVPQATGTVRKTQPTYGFIFDYSDDRAVQALARLLEKGFVARAAKEPFEIEGHSFTRGSILLKIHENPETLNQEILKTAEQTGVMIYGVNTALTTKGPDLGGNSFVLLESPRIAILTGPPINLTSFSALWHLLDYRLKFRVSILNANLLSSLDLKKYNVLILPSTWRGPQAYTQMLGNKGLKKIKDWTEDGGTLIGITNGAAFLADTASGLSNVRLRRQALKELNAFNKARQLEKEIDLVKVDSLEIWEGRKTEKQPPEAEKKSKQEEKELALADQRMRLFMPRGTIMSVELDPEHWLAFGLSKNVPSLIYTSYAYLSRTPVQTPARFSEAASLRLSGLLWPEARERWANTAYVTREAKGQGQIILFASEPNFRAYFHATERILLNALFLGPGFGARKTVPW